MIQIRRSSERGYFRHGWLDTYHTFAFGEYYDPAYVSFRSLRVMNEDRIAPGQGFGMHGHRDMEIVTYVLAGALEHRDSLGNGSVIQAGEFQKMTAGTGVRHSEFNPSTDESVHLYQIWILPREQGLEPSYCERRFDPREKRGRLCLVASPDGAHGGLPIFQDAYLHLAELEPGETVEHHLRAGRGAWLQVLSGRLEVNNLELAAGDGLAATDEPTLTVRNVAAGELLLFDLA